MFLNRARANDIMERENLDGLIALQAINVYYLTDYWGLFNTPVGYDAAYLAVLPRDEGEPASLIMPALEIRRVETKGTWMPNVFGYSSPGPDALFEDGTPKGTPYRGWPAHPGATTTPLEDRWLAIVDRLGEQMSPNAFWAVARAVKAAGLDKGRVATDDQRLQGWLEACGLDHIECVCRVDLFNEIRLVKTESELEIMRHAAKINEAALFAAADSMREGSTWNEIEDTYMANIAASGGRGVYLMCGVGELPAGQVRRGEPVMFDALGQYRRYHGDFGRCVVVGEPSALHRQRHAAICKGWEAAQELLKPGIRYSELGQGVADVVRKEGIPDFRIPVVHSLGLEHTDDPKAPGVQPQDKFDQTLQPNMVVNVDMPHSEIGWGGVHMEDTVVITKDGFEAFTTGDVSLRIN